MCGNRHAAPDRNGANITSIKYSIIGGLLAIVLFFAFTVDYAGAHYTDRGWHWTETRAANQLYAGTADFVTEVECGGIGRRWRGMYRHFYCDLFGDQYAPDGEYLWKCDDGYIGTAKLHVLSRTRYRLTYAQDWC